MVSSIDINPFTGPICTQDGMCICEDGRELAPEECVTIDWLVENVEGRIPDVSEMKEDAIDLVKLQGVKEALS